MSDGRTYWLALDAAWWDRALVAELTLTHGPTGPASILWLTCHAKAQNDAGRVKSGWAAVARGIGCNDRGPVERVLRHAADLGVLDDFEVLEDGLRFTCRISGWTADQERAAATFRQARARARQGVTDRDQTVTRDEEQGQGQEQETELRRDAPEIVALCELLAARMMANDAKAKTPSDSATWRDAMRKLVDLDGRTPDEVRAVIEWCQGDEFWRSNILSPGKLRDKFPQLLGRMQSTGAPRTQRRPATAGPTSAESNASAIAIARAKGYEITPEMEAYA